MLNHIGKLNFLMWNHCLASLWMENYKKPHGQNFSLHSNLFLKIFFFPNKANNKWGTYSSPLQGHCRCPYSLLWSWTRSPLKVPFQPKLFSLHDPMINTFTSYFYHVLILFFLTGKRFCNVNAKFSVWLLVLGKTQSFNQIYSLNYQLKTKKRFLFVCLS